MTKEYHTCEKCSDCPHPNFFQKDGVNYCRTCGVRVDI